MSSGSSPPSAPRSEPTMKPSPNRVTSSAKPESLLPSVCVANSGSATLNRPPMNIAPAEAAITTRMPAMRRAARRPRRVSCSSDSRSSPSAGATDAPQASRHSTDARDRERHAVDQHHALGVHQEQGRRHQRRPDRVAEVGDRPVERRRGGAALGGYQGRQARQRRGLEQRGTEPGDQRECEGRDERIHERDADERAGPQHVGDDGAGLARPAVGRRAQHRPEEHPREQVGQQHQPDRPGRMEALVGDQREERRMPRPCRATTGRALRRTRGLAAHPSRAGEWYARAGTYRVRRPPSERRFRRPDTRRGYAQRKRGRACRAAPFSNQLSDG